MRLVHPLLVLPVNESPVELPLLGRGLGILIVNVDPRLNLLFVSHSKSVSIGELPDGIQPLPFLSNTLQLNLLDLLDVLDLTDQV